MGASALRDFRSGLDSRRRLYRWQHSDKTADSVEEKKSISSRDRRAGRGSSNSTRRTGRAHEEGRQESGSRGRGDDGERDLGAPRPSIDARCRRSWSTLRLARARTRVPTRRGWACPCRPRRSVREEAEADARQGRRRSSARAESQELVGHARRDGEPAPPRRATDARDQLASTRSEASVAPVGGVPRRPTSMSVRQLGLDVGADEEAFIKKRLTGRADVGAAVS